ncbi:hypothetical protein ACVB8X_07385, partial [Streptomyces sp. NRAIS4]
RRGSNSSANRVDILRALPAADHGARPVRADCPGDRVGLCAGSQRKTHKYSNAGGIPDLIRMELATDAAPAAISGSTSRSRAQPSPVV